jgi:hypothetical protein
VVQFKLPMIGYRLRIWLVMFSGACSDRCEIPAQWRDFALQTANEKLPQQRRCSIARTLSIFSESEQTVPEANARAKIVRRQIHRSLSLLRTRLPRILSKFQVPAVRDGLFFRRA